MLLSDGIQSPRSASAAFQDHNYDNKDNVPSPADSFKKLQASGIVESKSFDIFTTLQEQDGRKGLFVDRGVGCTMFAKSFSSCSLASVLNFVTGKAMSEAAGAVAAAAVADQLHGSNEDRNLAIVLVGLRARGKTFTAVKLTRYLCELGHETRHFNVGKILCDALNSCSDLKLTNKKGHKQASVINGPHWRGKIKGCGQKLFRVKGEQSLKENRQTILHYCYRGVAYIEASATIYQDGKHTLRTRANKRRKKVLKKLFSPKF
ncbi:6-phosphofructo-2-kinase/fructose-2,6-bisphosphatase-like isoform X2 [Oryza brachyantha]|uniref:6-phosphofructo-2-kinase/fructose-2, 6-bisphosphatase-like isoform X2 n=1 Tax=Oryza brachyantha TaxID=4533 RepID=UPI001ADAC6F2|nr:6-phosphofructo-2-kinase/fructose-2,6-bisphosphatase-like isoform X2 [Oryza brachyantha]